MSSPSHAKTEQLIPQKLFDVKGWRAVVTGGGTGIGLMCAQALAAGGAKVYICGRRPEAVEAAAKHHSPGELGGEIIPIGNIDITSKEGINELVKQFKAKEDQLHLLINNAGIAGEQTHEVEKGDKSAQALQEELNKIDFDEFQSVYKTNVSSYYFTSVAFLDLLANATKKNRGFSSSIINISSISGITNTSQHHIPYNVSKAAVIQLTQLLAQEFSRPGIKVRVNSIAPGIFPSEMTADESDEKQKSHIDAEGYREKKGIPAGRPGRDIDMAQAIISTAVNQYMSGQIIAVDGSYLLSHG